VSGERRGPEHREPQDLSTLRRGDVLLPRPLQLALACPRHSVPRAAAEVRPPEVREPSRNQVSPVQGGDVLLREAHVGTLVGAREQVRGVVLVQNVGTNSSTLWVSGGSPSESGGSPNGSGGSLGSSEIRWFGNLLNKNCPRVVAVAIDVAVAVAAAVVAVAVTVVAVAVAIASNSWRSLEK
jgi:hypothetical protein